MGLKLISPPATTPVSLALAKAQVRVVNTASDELLSLHLEAATDRVERWLGRALIDQTWDLFLDEFPAADAVIEIPRPPLIEVEGVFYLDGDGAEQEMTEGFVVDAESAPARIALSTTSWPTAQAVANAVRVRYRAGYLDLTVSPAEANVPAAIRAGVLLYVGDLYEHRATLVVGDQPAKLPGYCEDMLRAYRVELGCA